MFDLEAIVRPATLADALAALAADPGAIPIAGGSDVLIRVREGKLAGCRLVSLHDLAELQGVTQEPDGTLCIGPGTSFVKLAHDPLILAHLPMLAEAAGLVGGPQLRVVATVGGNLCNGAPSADSAPALLCMNAQLELASQRATRTVALRDFYRGPGKVDRAADELLTAIRIAPGDYIDFGGRYCKAAQREAMDIATLGVAVYVRLDAAKTRVEELRLAFGVAAPTPIRLPKAEETARGLALSSALPDRVAEAVLDEISPRDSWRASRDYRLQLAGEYTRRALIDAINRAGGALYA